ncbi:carbamoyltransferase C-terminal domain-containing protein [Herbaspirillum sp. SJZ107]|uniref:carbamoyltransferase family protein n=1 Tax=Herbaspirillum sp. SJZ107 TaxID=2572881 RepID=UPI00114FD16E|nr:carbamoyltransferase C-terminal domain-containing protein [Herbaspirillum sp. SJZ107]TQK05626.1 carbamoyltransferase [Herbaspirillum sp. SJZ107]
MNEAPVVLGINRTQDASVCLMQGSRLLWAIQKERLTRRKHHWGKVGDFRDHYGPRLPWPERPIDVVVECFSSDLEAGNLALYEDELTASLRLAPDCRRARISHHLAHVYSVFHPSPFRDAAVMIVDGQGSPVSELTEHWGGAAYVPGDWREVASFYRADRERVLCIDKQVWNRDDARLVGLGMFYFLLTQTVFPGEGNEGKVMGLAPHGNARVLGLPPLDVEAGQVSIPAPWRAILHERERFRYGQPGTAFDDCANLAAAGQRAFEDALLEVARWLHAQTGLPRLCFAGGTALNCSANERLLRETPFREVFIPPAPSDAGTALGCAMYGLAELCHESPAFRWTRDDLGPAPSRQDIEAALLDRDDVKVDYLPGLDALSSHMLDLLRNNRVLGLLQGASEFGPRALGHRSILADPRRAAMRDWINARVKQREWFRPLAPVVLEERAPAYFDLPGPSPFMQFAAPVRPQMAARVPAITHVDGTARLQTVGPDGDPLLRRLLGGFEARTGVPILLNTSFNGKDEPIVETPREALAAFRQMPLHALSMPPFLVTKRIEPELPA